MTISPQAAKINQLRAILQPTPVEKEKFPRWFRLRRGDKLPRFFDHWGRTMTRGGNVVVAEPYFTAMTEEQWEEVRRFAIKYDLKYMVVPKFLPFPRSNAANRVLEQRALLGRNAGRSPFL